MTIRARPMHRPLLALAAASLVVAAAAAQQPTTQPTGKPRSKASPSIAVHEAWLREVLDLDVTGAVRGYDRLRRESPRNQPERWIAVARLAELQRLGVTTPEPIPAPNVSTQQAPPEVRAALSQLDAPVPVDELLADSLAEVRLPPLHPATRDVQEWVRNQLGPTVDERLRLRFRRRAVPRFSERWYAYDILSAELANRPAQAQAFRTLVFANWQPPQPTGTAVETLAAARERLEAWIADPETSSQHRTLLRQLGTAMEALAEKDAAAAIDFVARLPIYAERLLLGQVATESTTGEQGSRR